MSQQALGMIETIHVAAIVAADTAVKTANVSLLGVENSLFAGMFVVKLQGDYGAVKAAVDAAAAAAREVGPVHYATVIARPSDEVERVILQEQIVSTSVCNLCEDEACPRQKGDQRSDCIHYEDK